MKNTSTTIRKTDDRAIRYGLLLIGLFLASIWFNPIKAQMHIGVRGGLAFSEPGLSTPLGATQSLTKTFTSIDMAIVSEMKLANRLSLQAELGYSEKGIRLGTSTDLNVFGATIPVGITSTTKVRQLELPILAKYELTTGGFDMYAIAGPSMSYNLNGNFRTRGTGITDVRLINENFEIGQQYRFGLGLVGGLGIEKAMGNGKLFVDARYTYQSIDIPNVDINNLRFKNNGMGLQVGYKFNL